MDAPIVYWLLFRAASSLFAYSLIVFLLHLRNRQAKSTPRPKKPVEAPNGLPVLGHAVAFSKDQAGFAMALKYVRDED